MKKKPARRNYINNREMFDALVAYLNEVKAAKKARKDQLPRIPHYLGECFEELAYRISNRPNFYSYSFKDEMKRDAIENCVMQIHSFNPKKSSNPFSYFTMIMINAFIRRIKKERRYQYIKVKNLDNLNMADELAGIAGEQTEVNEITHEFVRAFEESVAKAKKPPEKKKLIVSRFMKKVPNGRSKKPATTEHH